MRQMTGSSLVDLLLFGLSVSLTFGSGQGQRRGHGLDKEDFVATGEIDNPLRKEGFVQDKDHLLEHLGDRLQIDKEKLEDLSESESNFIFFKSHDFNGDDLLDGLELYHSIMHGVEEFMEDLGDDPKDEIKQTTKRVMTERLILAVDRILKEDDNDRDGYLSYGEFAHARLASKTLTEFDEIKGQA